MNDNLWNKILQFDLDSPPSEYGFSTRLAKENYWTKDFTEQAILEYKKFMYLAASSDLMVSPSEIVDTVWHQHLIFTASYQDLCHLVGKQIQHVPSTHNKEDFQKFQQAKERTRKLYEDTFANQPKGIWDYGDMFESLKLDKAKFKLRTFLIFGILAAIVLIAPCYLLLKPIFASIDNPDFILIFLAISVTAFVGLEFYNRERLKQIIDRADKNAFIYNLHPFELIYLQTQNISNIISGTVNELIENKSIKVKSDNNLELQTEHSHNSNEQIQTITLLRELGKTPYPKLAKQLATKPIFLNSAICMDALKKYFNKSTKFGQVFYLNFGLLSLLVILGMARLLAGISRDRPVILIAIVIVLLTNAVILYLNRLTKMVCTETIPNLYKTEILPTRQVADQWQWSYFLLGASALSISFAPLAGRVNKNSNDNSGCGTSSDSSCGSSCSSCGGCGGD